MHLPSFCNNPWLPGVLAGMVPIFLSWFTSPILSGLICAILFLTLRTFVLRSEHALGRSMIALPILVGGTVWLVVSFIVQTGNKNATWEKTSNAFVIWIGAAVGTGVAVLFAVVLMPFLMKKIHTEKADR